MPPCGSDEFAHCWERAVSGPSRPLRRREGHKAVVPFFARRVPVEVQGQMPFMSIRSRWGEFSEGRATLSSLLPAVKEVEEGATALTARR
jgi:hypothetical protein